MANTFACPPRSLKARDTVLIHNYRSYCCCSSLHVAGERALFECKTCTSFEVISLASCISYVIIKFYSLLKCFIQSNSKLLENVPSGIHLFRIGHHGQGFPQTFLVNTKRNIKDVTSYVPPRPPPHHTVPFLQNPMTHWIFRRPVRYLFRPTQVKK